MKMTITVRKKSPAETKFFDFFDFLKRSASGMTFVFSVTKDFICFSCFKVFEISTTSVVGMNDESLLDTERSLFSKYSLYINLKIVTSSIQPI